MAVNAIINDSQLTTKIRGILNAWAFSDSQDLGFGSNTDAVFQFDGTYFRGPNPGSSSNMWNACPALAYADPNVAGFFREDFIKYHVDEWALSQLGGGSGTVALSEVADKTGVGAIVLDAAAVTATHGIQIQLGNTAGEMWDLESATTGKKLWFEIKLQVVESNDCNIVVGLHVRDTDVIDKDVDGIYFHKDDGDTNWDFASYNGGSAGEVASVGTAANDTWIRLGFYYDGAGTLTPYVNGTAGTAITTAARIPTEDQLTLSIGIENGDGGAVRNYMYVDYVKVVQTR